MVVMSKIPSQAGGAGPICERHCILAFQSTLIVRRTYAFKIEDVFDMRSSDCR